MVGVFRFFWCSSMRSSRMTWPTERARSLRMNQGKSTSVMVIAVRAAMRIRKLG